MEHQYAKPKQGCKVTIDFAFKSYNIHNPNLVTFSLTGVVVPDTKWTPDNFVRILTSHDIVAYREIPLDKITKIKYEDGTLGSTQPIETQSKSYTIQGSKGNTYIVTNNKTAWTCSCTGYQFRKMCKHIDKFKNVSN
jgi:hypothetical protein